MLDRVIERDGLLGAWVGHLPSAFHRDPSAGNADLIAALEPFPRLKPVRVIRPDWPGWESQLKAARDAGAPAVRAYPQHWGYGSDNRATCELAIAAGDGNVALTL